MRGVDPQCGCLTDHSSPVVARVASGGVKGWFLHMMLDKSTLQGVHVNKTTVTTCTARPPSRGAASSPPEPTEGGGPPDRTGGETGFGS